jgi:hypothetical protein
MRVRTLLNEEGTKEQIGQLRKTKHPASQFQTKSGKVFVTSQARKSQMSCLSSQQWNPRNRRASAKTKNPTHCRLEFLFPYDGADRPTPYQQISSVFGWHPARLWKQHPHPLQFGAQWSVAYVPFQAQGYTTPPVDGPLQ